MRFRPRFGVQEYLANGEPFAFRSGVGTADTYSLGARSYASYLATIKIV